MKKILFSLFVVVVITACNSDDNQALAPEVCATQNLGITDSPEFKNPNFGFEPSNIGTVWKWNKVGDTLNVWHILPSACMGTLYEYSFLAKKGACIKAIQLKRTSTSIDPPSQIVNIYTDTIDFVVTVQEYNENVALKMNVKTAIHSDRKGWVDLTPQNNEATPNLQ